MYNRLVARAETVGTTEQDTLTPEIDFVIEHIQSLGQADIEYVSHLAAIPDRGTANYSPQTENFRMGISFTGLDGDVILDFSINGSAKGRLEAELVIRNKLGNIMDPEQAPVKLNYFRFIGERDRLSGGDALERAREVFPVPIQSDP